MLHIRRQFFDLKVFQLEPTYRFTFSELLLGTIKVKVDVQTFNKLCDGIPVCVGLLKQEEGFYHDKLIGQVSKIFGTKVVHSSH